MYARIRLGSLIAACSLLFLSACVSTSFLPARNFEERNARPVSPGEVRVLTSPPNQAFLPLGVIEAYISGYPSDETIIRKARERAATIGADAILINADRDMLWGPPAVGNEGESDRNRKLIYVRFTAIRFLPEDSSRLHP